MIYSNSWSCSFVFFFGFFCVSSPPYVILPIDDRLSLAQKPSAKTKLSPVPSNNNPIDILDKAKRNRVKNSTRDDVIIDSDEEEIQGDASGITVPLSKSLGKLKH